MLKKKLIKEDVLEGEVDDLKYIGGVDISFLKEDSSIACGTLVVLDLQTLQVLYDDFSLVTVQVPYVPGFLAFREVSFQFSFTCSLVLFSFKYSFIYLFADWRFLLLPIINLFRYW